MRRLFDLKRLDGTSEYIKQIEYHFKGELKSPLKKTIKDIYIPAQISSNAKKYAKDNSIEIGKDKTIRDYLSREILESIVKVEEDINGYIGD